MWLLKNLSCEIIGGLQKSRKDNGDSSHAPPTKVPSADILQAQHNGEN